MSEPFTMQRRVGRVIEARVFALKTRDDADIYSQALAAEVMRTPATMQPILCADHRPVRIYPQPAADRLTELFQKMNTRLDRIAILVSPTNATLNLQLQRIVREAGYENRKVMHEPSEALAHLHDSLNPEERERVREFLAEYEDKGQTSF
ncbi:MAG: hypothetical protein H6718_08095 [Polyangiaceae bacterium]|nr:hypothetical protein [Polyangiaceae bacterium]